MLLLCGFKIMSLSIRHVSLHFAGLSEPRGGWERAPPILSLLEACFDMISGTSLYMKIQIMSGKITENLGFKSPLRKVKKFLFFFLFIFKFSKKNYISLSEIIFEYLVLQIRYQYKQRFSTPFI